MKTLTELKLLANKYIEEKKGENVVLCEPIFRCEKGNLVLGYMILDFIYSCNNNNIKRPTEFLIQNIENGDIIEFNDIKIKKFNDLPLTFSNKGTSPLYDEINNIIFSFDK